MVEIKLKNLTLVINFWTVLFHFFSSLGTVYTYMCNWFSRATWDVVLKKREAPLNTTIGNFPYKYRWGGFWWLRDLTCHTALIYIYHTRHNLLFQSVLLYQVRQETGCAFFYLDEKAMRMWLKRGWDGMAAFNSWK